MLVYMISIHHQILHLFSVYMNLIAMHTRFYASYLFDYPLQLLVGLIHSYFCLSHYFLLVTSQRAKMDRLQGLLSVSDFFGSQSRFDEIACLD